MRYLERDIWHLHLRLGPLVTSRLQKNHYAGVSNSHPGYGFSIATTMHCHRPFKLVLSMLLMTKSHGPSINCSMQWNLFCPRIVSWDSQIIHLALCGDVNNIRTAISTRQSTPFDQTPDGSTLLHVRYQSPCPQRFRLTVDQLAASNGHLELVKCLRQAGALADAVNHFGE